MQIAATALATAAWKASASKAEQSEAYRKAATDGTSGRPSNRQTSNRQTSNDRGSAEAQCHHRCFRQRRCGLNKTALDMSPRKPPRGTPELVERRASTDRAQERAQGQTALVEQKPGVSNKDDEGQRPRGRALPYCLLQAERQKASGVKTQASRL